MKERIEKIIKAGMENKTSFGFWIAYFVSLVGLRTLLENFSSPGAFGSLDSSLGIFIHYTLFYLGLVLALVLLVSKFARLSAKLMIRLVPFVLPVICLPPIIDLIWSGGNQPMSYIFTNLGGLGAAFLTFFGSSTAAGITLGIRAELIILLLAIFLFVLKTRKDWRPALWATVISYIIVFLWLSVPSIIYLVMPGGLAVNAAGGTIIDFYRQINGVSLTAFGVNDLSSALSPDKSLAAFVSAVMARIHLLAVILLAAAWYAVASWKKFKAMAVNAQPERLVHWLILFIIGITASIQIFGKGLQSWNDWTALIVALISLFSAWLFAVATNDLADWKLDAAANPKRPLPSGTISSDEMVSLSIFFLLVSLIGGWLSGPPVLFAIITFTASYWIYSMPPLRLKRWPFVNSFLVSLACLSAALAGFFLTNPSSALAIFPGRIAWLIVIGFTLAANVKDIKDIEGDKAEGIKTLPVILGADRGKKVIAILLALAFWSVPIILLTPVLALTAFPAGIAAWLLVTRKEYKEIYIFLLYFAFAIASLALVA